MSGSAFVGAVPNSSGAIAVEYLLAPAVVDPEVDDLDLVPKIFVIIDFEDIIEVVSIRSKDIRDFVFILT